jgi:hypothetical protein
VLRLRHDWPIRQAGTWSAQASCTTVKQERDIIPKTAESFAAARTGQTLDTLPWESLVCGSHVLPLILYLSGGMNASCS